MNFNNHLQWALSSDTLKACSKDENDRIFWIHFCRLMELAMNVYEWENLPDSVNERYLELQLFEKGYAIYFNDEIIGNLALGGTIGGKFNVYLVPINRVAISAGGINGVGYRKDLTDTDSVIIFNNYLRQPTVNIALEYARRLAIIDRTIDVNINAQKTPIVLTTTTNQLKTIKTAYQKISNNEPVIIADKNFATSNDIKALNTQAPIVFPQLQIQKKQEIYDYLTKIGVENSPQEKKERVISDEASGNLGSVEANRCVGLNSRQQAAKEINKMFGTNINVKFRSNIVSMINKPDQFYEGEVENEPVYNTDTRDS